jgi:hypothetical protein
MKWRSGRERRTASASIISLGLIALAVGSWCSPMRLPSLMKRRDAHRAFGKVSGRDTSVAR